MSLAGKNKGKYWVLMEGGFKEGVEGRIIKCLDYWEIEGGGNEHIKIHIILLMDNSVLLQVILRSRLYLQAKGVLEESKGGGNIGIYIYIYIGNKAAISSVGPIGSQLITTSFTHDVTKNFIMAKNSVLIDIGIIREVGLALNYQVYIYIYINNLCRGIKNYISYLKTEELISYWNAAVHTLCL